MVDRRALLLEQLAEADQRIFESEKRIERHKQSIAELEAAGRETATAQVLLEMALTTHATQIAERDRLKLRISQL